MTNEELALSVRDGSADVILLWERVEKFICMKAGQYERSLDGCRGVTEEDLRQVGFFALLDAIELYDPNRGASFLHYLSFHLQHHFNEAAGLRTARTTGDPVNSSISLDEPIGEDQDSVLSDLLADGRDDMEGAEQRLYVRQLREALEKALADLTPSEADIIRARYFQNKTLREIAEDRGISQTRVQQQEQKGLRKLRSRRHKNALESYIDLRTHYYSRSHFKYTLTSPVESLVMLREKLRQEYEEKARLRAAGGKVWRRHRQAYRGEL